MRFSQTFGIVDDPNDDWFDTFLPADTNLYIDPFLIWEDKEALWQAAHDTLIEFFAMVIGLVRESGGDKNHNSWKQAERLLLFPEPAEFCLGVAEGSPLGAGAGRGLQREMLEGIRIAVDAGMNRVAHLETLTLFQGGMGLDRISDTTCNVLKRHFIEYTASVARRHGVPTQAVLVEHASWSAEYCRWIDSRHTLPVNPFTGRPILLVPERFLRDLPVASPDGFWSWSWSNISSDLRTDLNFDIARRVNRADKAKLARENPDAVALYLRHLETEEFAPYPVVADPKNRVRWNEREESKASGTPLGFVAQNPEEFPRFVSTLIEAFRHGVEEEGNWSLLWHRGESVGEKSAQALFRNTVVSYCRANDIDLTGESNAGRGPVDFKFSRGWQSRALVELKLVRNTGFWDGLLAQQPQYQNSEEIAHGFFVAIAYEDNELTDVFREKLVKAARLVQEQNGFTIQPIIVDARPKKSASKLTNPDLKSRLKDDTD